MFSRIVKFKNGKYAIRKWSFKEWAYVYLDHKSSSFSWRISEKYFDHCLFDSYKDAVEFKKGLVVDYGTPVKE